MKPKRGITESRRDEVIPDRLHIKKLAFETGANKIKIIRQDSFWVVEILKMNWFPKFQQGSLLLV